MNAPPIAYAFSVLLLIAAGLIVHASHAAAFGIVLAVILVGIVVAIRGRPSLVLLVYFSFYVLLGLGEEAVFGRKRRGLLVGRLGLHRGAAESDGVGQGHGKSTEGDARGRPARRGRRSHCAPGRFELEGGACAKQGAAAASRSQCRFRSNRVR